MKRVLVGLLALGIICTFTPALMSADKECPLAAAKAGKVCPVTGKVIQTAAAQDGEKPCCAKGQTVSAKSDCAGKAACGAVAKAGCPIEKAVHEAATVMFRVGDFQTSDGQAAVAVAARTKQAMEFMVGDESFSNVADAAAAINKRIDAKIGEMTTVSYAVGKECLSCPNAAASLAKQTKSPVLYRVANVDFQDRPAAEKAAQRAKQAASSLLMAYQVGEESYCCDKMAGEAAVAKGKPIKFLIQGQTTSCPLDAALKMATAKMEALFKAVADPQSS